MRYPGRVLKRGEADSSAVSALHQQLIRHGCGPVDDDGIFGEETEAVVRLFQVRNVDGSGRPLRPDGEVGPLTWAALFGADTVPVLRTAASPLLEAVLVHARSQLHVREEPSDSNSGPEVDEYLTRAGVSLQLPVTSKPWCCAFVYWCFDEAARRSGRANPMVRTAGCIDHWNRAESQHARRITATRATDDPALISPGMVFIMDFGQGHGHTGLIEELAGGFLYTIEGNTNASRTREGGGVYRLQRKIADVNVGFIDYSGV
jgi:hypothetical protein